MASAAIGVMKYVKIMVSSWRSHVTRKMAYSAWRFQLALYSPTQLPRALAKISSAAPLMAPLRLQRSLSRRIIASSYLALYNEASPSRRSRALQHLNAPHRSHRDSGVAA